MKRFLLTLLPATAWAQEKPNVIWLMADDLGYGDISCYGATRVQTPNIDRVASQGVRFTDMHACASTSTPRITSAAATAAIRIHCQGSIRLPPFPFVHCRVRVWNTDIAFS